MIIKEVLHAPYELHFSKSLLTSKTTLSSKKGFIIKFVSDEGTGYGDVSPLPLFSTESYEDTLDSFRKAIPLIKQKKFTDFENIAEYLDTINILPTVRFGIEQAFASIQIQNGSNFFNNINPKRISVNALWNENDTGINDYDTVKIKVGIKEFSEEVKLIEKIKSRHPYIKIRLDANGKWGYDEACKNIDRLQEYGIEYIEDPVSSIEEMIKLSETCETPVAIDEPVRSHTSLNNLITNSPIKFFVIKPSLLGSVYYTANAIRKAEEYGKAIIVSSAFESAVGRSMVTVLASLTAHGYAHGLATTSFIKQDLCDDIYPVDKGKINLDIKKYLTHYQLNLNFHD